jgi:hypothetical protein
MRNTPQAVKKEHQEATSPRLNVSHPRRQAADTKRGRKMKGKISSTL